MHVHTTMASSDSMLDPHDLVRIAAGNTLTAVNITEHDQVIEPHQQVAFREEHPDFLVNFGMEVSTDMGHMIAVGLRTYLPGIRRAEQLRAELDQLGGFLIVGHPFRRLFDPVTAMRTGEVLPGPGRIDSDLTVCEVGGANHDHVDLTHLQHLSVVGEVVRYVKGLGECFSVSGGRRSDCDDLGIVHRLQRSGMNGRDES